MPRSQLAAAVAALLLVAGCGGDQPRSSGDALALPDAPRCTDATWGESERLFLAGTARDCTIRSKGRERTFTFYEPDSLGSEPVALVLVLHGEGGPESSPLGAARASRYDRLAEREGVAVAFPAGADGVWNESEPELTTADQPDDLAFVADVIDTAARLRAIDERRVYAIGWSAGGAMAHRLGCDLGERVTAIAVLHGAPGGACGPERPVPVLQLAGSADAVLDPADAIAGAERWRELDRCGKATTRRTRWLERTLARRCGAGSAVELVVVRGGGHSWFGPGAAARADRAIDATRASWRFFSRYERG